MPSPYCKGGRYNFPRRQLIFRFVMRVIKSLRVHSEIDSV